MDPNSRLILRLYNLHHRSITVQNCGFYFFGSSQWSGLWEPLTESTLWNDPRLGSRLGLCSACMWNRRAKAFPWFCKHRCKTLLARTQCLCDLLHIKPRRRPQAGRPVESTNMDRLMSPSCIGRSHGLSQNSADGIESRQTSSSSKRSPYRFRASLEDFFEGYIPREST